MNWKFLYRNRDIFALLFLMAFCATMTVPVILLFAVQEIGATPFQGALVFTASAFVGMLLVPQIGKFSDRMGQNKPVIIVSLIWLALGSFATSMVSSVFQMIALSIVFFCVFAVPSSQLFALARKRLEQTQNEDSSSVSALRIGYIAGWVAGPVAPGILLTLGYSYRNLYVIQAGLYLFTALMVVIFIADLKSAHKKSEKQQKPAPKIPLELLLVLAVVVLVLSGDMIRVVGLPLFVVQDLGASAASVSFAFSIVPMVEIPATILAIWIAKKYGEPLAMLLGIVAALIYFTAMPLTNTLWQVYAIQIIYALVPATSIGIAIAFTQSLLPGRPGYASSLALSAQSGAIVLGNIFMAGGMLMLGPRLTYYIPLASALLALLCLGGVFLLHKRKTLPV